MLYKNNSDNYYCVLKILVYHFIVSITQWEEFSFLFFGGGGGRGAKKVSEQNISQNSNET